MSPIDEALDKTKETENTIKIVNAINSLKDAVNEANTNITTRIDSLKTAIEQNQYYQQPASTTNSKGNYFYIFLLALTIAFTILIIYRGWINETNISIEYNVGEIIAGGAALVASAAYALKQSRLK